MIARHSISTGKNFAPLRLPKIFYYGFDSSWPDIKVPTVDEYEGEIFIYTHRLKSEVKTGSRRFTNQQ